MMPCEPVEPMLTREWPVRDLIVVLLVVLSLSAQSLAGEFDVPAQLKTDRLTWGRKSNSTVEVIPGQGPKREACFRAKADLSTIHYGWVHLVARPPLNLTGTTGVEFEFKTLSGDAHLRPFVIQNKGGERPFSGPTYPLQVGEWRKVFVSWDDFSLFPLDLPELAAVKASVEQSDWTAARAALVKHFRTRTSPRYFYSPDDREEIVKRFEKLHEWYAWMLMQDGRTPCPGDSGSVNPRNILAYAAAALERPDLKFASRAKTLSLSFIWVGGTELIERFARLAPEPPPRASTLLPDAQYIIFRNTWQNLGNGTSLFFDCDVDLPCEFHVRFGVDESASKRSWRRSALTAELHSKA